MSILCVIPAKGKSTRIPRKNIKTFIGKPVIEYSLSLAKTISCDTVVVSSDDDEILRLANDFGVIAFRRSAASCSDDAPMVWALREVMEVYPSDIVLMLYAVAPFAEADDIVQGLKIINRYPVVYPVYHAREHMERALIKRGGVVIPRYPEYKETNSQYFEPTYHSAGQWYLAQSSWILERGTLTPLESGYVEIPALRAVDIDTEDDWEIAEALYTRWHHERC